MRDVVCVLLLSIGSIPVKLQYQQLFGRPLADAARIDFYSINKIDPNINKMKWNSMGETRNSITRV